MQWFIWGEETKECLEKSITDIVFKLSFLSSLVLQDFMVNQSKLLAPNAIVSCLVFVRML